MRWSTRSRQGIVAPAFESTQSKAAPDGTEKSGDDDISNVRSYSYGDYYYDYAYSYNAAPQLIDGTVYMAAGWDGIVSINVK